jgi:hypothetical protein
VDVRGVVEAFVATGVVVPLVLGAIASAGITRALLRRGHTHAPGWLVLAAVLSIVGALVMTLFREVVPLVQHFAAGGAAEWPGLGGLRRWSEDGWWRATHDPLGSMQILLNVALFVPAGLLWTVVTRRPAATMLALTATSVGVELIQAVTGLGANDAADILANTAGAALGVLAGMVAWWVRAELVGHHAGSRRWLLRAASAAGVVAIGSAAMLGGAAVRQDALATQATTAFADTDLRDVRRWERAEELPERVWFGALEPDVDGFVRAPDTVTARYPASVVAVHRCVLVVWTEDTVTIDRRAGDVCQAHVRDSGS